MRDRDSHLKKIGFLGKQARRHVRVCHGDVIAMFEFHVGLFARINFFLAGVAFPLSRLLYALRWQV